MPSARRRFPAGPAVVGILNLTPDSFSDGGQLPDAGAARDRALALLSDGACALDLGAESTRPGAAEVPPAEERSRLLPALRAIRAATEAPLSVDTRHAEVARAALDEGADIINDVSALRFDPAMAAIVAGSGAGLVLMHSRGTPATMQDRPRYARVMAEVRLELDAAVARALDAGCDASAIVLDPGFGFAKTADHNLELLRAMPLLRGAGFPIMAGLSRKGLVGALLTRDGVTPPPALRAAGSVGLALAAITCGASLVRVHDVRETVEALACYRAVLPPGAPRGEAPWRAG